LDYNELKDLVLRSINQPIPSWEQEYLNYHVARFAETLRLLGPGEELRLLDVGAFPGHLTLAVKAAGFRVEALTGTGESSRGLEVFKNRLTRQQIPVVLADVESDPFPFPDKSFDVVLAAEIFEHLPFNPYHMLREAFRVLRPGGQLLLSTPNLPKLDNWIRLALGRSIHPDVRLPFHKSFKSILVGRHIREYTASELIYMLEGQNKEMFRFEGTRISYSICLDPALSWAGAPFWAMKKIWPRTRATLFVQSYRPTSLSLIPLKEVGARGFYELEEHHPRMGSTGRILATPFRWSGGQAELDLPAGNAPLQVFILHLVFLAPRSLPPVILSLTIREKDLAKVALNPGREYVPVRLVLPLELAEKGTFKLAWSCGTWRPSDHAEKMDYYEFSATDNRDLGVALAWDGLLREDCQDLGGLKKTAQREKDRSVLREGWEGQWSSLTGLYWVQAEIKSRLKIGPGDWRQLGVGWFKLERWPQGWIRWSSKSSEVYLSPRLDSSRIFIRVYTGDKALGGEIGGGIEVHWAPDRLVFHPLINKAFLQPTDQWTDLEVPLPPSLPPEGLLRVLIEVHPTRIPARLIPGSQDERELGLAVSGLTIS
jgi:SAM-dependent methyltransferase